MSETHSSSSGGMADPLIADDGPSDLEDDVLAQLAQKERDLILAAELGKALLDSNQELQLRYDHAVDEFSHKIEELQQEKHDLHLELEKIETEYQNTIKDLQDEASSLRKQLRANDDLKVSERERSRTLREAQLNSDYYMDEIRKAAKREEELKEELHEQREKIESHKATIKDQMDHITMLRDQVEYLSEKLKESNQKLAQVQGERDALINNLEVTQEKTHSLEEKITVQSEKIHRQTCEIEELQEVNSDLQLQLEYQQHHTYHRHHRKSSLGSNRNMNNNTTKSFQQNTLFQELTQEKRTLNLAEAGSSADQGLDDRGSFEDGHKQSWAMTEPLVSNELTSAHPPLSEVVYTHSRNASNCSLSSLVEGSRKRHHNYIGGSSDDDYETDMDDVNRSFNCKQTLYSDLKNKYQSNITAGVSVTPCSIDSNGNSVSVFNSTNIFNKDACRSIHVEPIQHTQSAFDRPDLILNSPTDNPTAASTCKSLFDELTSDSNKEHINLPPDLSELKRQETSLFTELSSQLTDDKAGSGSDSPSNCALGVFDFNSSSEPSSHEADGHSNESLNQSMEIRSRLESDLSMTSEWYYMTPVTSEMLDDDDFECDDDDFLVGNIAGSTLSIGDSSHVPSYQFHFNKEKGEGPLSTSETITKRDNPSLKDHHDSNHGIQQQQLTEACLQIRELVVKLQGHCDINKNLEDGAVTTDDLLLLVAQMKICIDNFAAQKTEVSKNRQ